MDYLKVWTSFREVIAPLGDAEKGRLFDAMLTYAETGEEPSEFKGNERFLWPVAKQDIDRTAQKCENLRANAAKGGLAKSRNKQELANDSKSYQTLAKPSHKDNDKDNVKEKTKEVSKRFSPPTLEEVTAYCKERSNKVDPQRFIDFYASKGWKVGNTPMKDWKACVRTWEQRDNAPAQPKQVVAQTYGQREYKDELYESPEKMLEELMRA